MQKLLNISYTFEALSSAPTLKSKKTQKMGRKGMEAMIVILQEHYKSAVIGTHKDQENHQKDSAQVNIFSPVNMTENFDLFTSQQR